MDDKEFAGIVNSTKPIVLSAIKKHLDSHYFHSIDDIVQETYLRAYRSLLKNSFRGDSSMETWLYAIARNESLRMMKKINREEMKVRKKAQKMDEMALKKQAEERDDVNIKKIDLKRTISILPEKYRRVMELVSLGFSEKQIADELSLKKGTVKSRIFRGKFLLQRIIAGGVKNDN
ncbi:MAG: sigma-70 family RNA polymerase sigma factor [Spirochaetes bacterium]|nr:sigma-70 family RNA polymerase sigma factor [Spirochaetota bacterium]